MFFFTQGSTPFPEVTGLFCRVPWPEFSRAPWIIHPPHLSWFAVRFTKAKLRGFSWQYGLNGFSLTARIRFSDGGYGFTYSLVLPAYTGTSNTRTVYLSASPRRTLS